MICYRLLPWSVIEHTERCSKMEVWPKHWLRLGIRKPCCRCGSDDLAACELLGLRFKAVVFGLGPTSALRLKLAVATDKLGRKTVQRSVLNVAFFLSFFPPFMSQISPCWMAEAFISLRFLKMHTQIKFSVSAKQYLAVWPFRDEWSKPLSRWGVLRPRLFIYKEIMSLMSLIWKQGHLLTVEKWKIKDRWVNLAVQKKDWKLLLWKSTLI